MHILKSLKAAALVGALVAVTLVAAPYIAAQSYPGYVGSGYGVILDPNGRCVIGWSNAALASTITCQSGALLWRTDENKLYTMTAGSWTLTTLTAPTLAGSITGTYTLGGTPTITAPVVNQAMIAGGSALTLTAAAHDGKTIALDTAAGTTITLPAATGSGMRFCFVVTVAATSNQHRINVVGNDAFFGGIAQGNDTDNTTVTWPTAADADQINMSGTATGGFKGAKYCIEDVVTDGWSVIGESDASGTEATPFATGQVS